jgi:hypothetical protein
MKERLVIRAFKSCLEVHSQFAFSWCAYVYLAHQHECNRIPQYMSNAELREIQSTLSGVIISVFLVQPTGILQ